MIFALETGTIISIVVFAIVLVALVLFFVLTGLKEQKAYKDEKARREAPGETKEERAARIKAYKEAKKGKKK